MFEGRLAAVSRMIHMVQAADIVAEYVARGHDAFVGDPAILDAISYRIIVLGEAAKAVLDADPTIEAEVAGVEWSPLAKMRDFLAHQYWRTNPEIVWATAQDDIPRIKESLKEALQRLV